MNFYAIEDGNKSLPKCKVCKQTFSANTEKFKAHSSKSVRGNRMCTNKEDDDW